MSYRDQVRAIQHDTDIELGKREGHADGFREGKEIGGSEKVLRKDRIAAFNAGLDFAGSDARDIKNNRPYGPGDYLRYTDPRGCTFVRGGMVYVESEELVYVIERVFEDRILASDETDIYPQEFDIEDCRPLGGYTTPNNFFPLHASCARLSDGQLGIAVNSREGRRVIGYGPTSEIAAGDDLNDWVEYYPCAEQWVSTINNVWYRITEVRNNEVVLDDDGPRYSGHCLPGDDTQIIPNLRLVTVKPHYPGECVEIVTTGVTGLIEQIACTNSAATCYWVRDEHGTAHNAWDTELVSIPFYPTQHVIHDATHLLVDAVGYQYTDGRLQATVLRVKHLDGEQTFSIPADAAVGLVQIDSMEGVTVWVVPTDEQSLYECYTLCAELLTADGTRKLASLLRNVYLTKGHAHERR